MKKEKEIVISKEVTSLAQTIGETLNIKKYEIKIANGTFLIKYNISLVTSVKIMNMYELITEKNVFIYITPNRKDKDNNTLIINVDTRIKPQTIEKDNNINGIIINNKVYELVETSLDAENTCKVCDLHDSCIQPICIGLSHSLMGENIKVKAGKTIFKLKK